MNVQCSLMKSVINYIYQLALFGDKDGENPISNSNQIALHPLSLDINHKPNCIEMDSIPKIKDEINGYLYIYGQYQKIHLVI